MVIEISIKIALVSIKPFVPFGQFFRDHTRFYREQRLVLDPLHLTRVIKPMTIRWVELKEKADVCFDFWKADWPRMRQLLDGCAIVEPKVVDSPLDHPYAEQRISKGL